MGKKVMPSILAAFKENGYDPYEATKDKDSGFDYLVSFAGNLFHIACDLSFIKSDHGLYGLGTGGHFALGYLYSVADTFTVATVKHHAQKAIQIASVLDVNTCLPSQYVSQDKEN